MRNPWIGFKFASLYLKYFKLDTWMLCMGNWGIGIIHHDKNYKMRYPYDDKAND